MRLDSQLEELHILRLIPFDSQITMYVNSAPGTVVQPFLKRVRELIHIHTVGPHSTTELRSRHANNFIGVLESDRHLQQTYGTGPKSRTPADAQRCNINAEPAPAHRGEMPYEDWVLTCRYVSTILLLGSFRRGNCYTQNFDDRYNLRLWTPVLQHPFTVNKQSGLLYVI